MQEDAIARHYAQLIGLEKPWRVSRVEVSHREQEVQIFVVRGSGGRLRCPECGRPCAGYDTRQRRWRHLDTMQYRTYLIAEVPRVECAAIQWIAMDMWAPYIAATRAKVPEADAKIVFDRFHVAQHLGDAVDQVRRRENRELAAAGDERLKGTKYLWLQRLERMSAEQWEAFVRLRGSRLKVARAWAIKEAAKELWGYARRGWAQRMWERWYAWAIRSRLEPIKRVARMIKRHWEGVLNAATTDVTNARAEAINNRIQWVKRMACGYRNRENFRDAIYFHLGGLDLYPKDLGSTHPNA